MGDFTLDTSGVVEGPIWLDGQCFDALGWAALAPFTQGYIEALLTDFARGQWPVSFRTNTILGDHFGFRFLAPETLARIIAECGAFQNYANGLGLKTGASEGEHFWRGRQSGSLPGAWGAAFPPLTPYLGDDGKVYLREDAQ